MSREPLSSPQSEEAIIGTVMGGYAWDAAWGVEPEDFYVPGNRVVWEAILSVMSVGIKPDHLTVAAWLEKHGKLRTAGGPQRLMEYDQKVPIVPNVAEWVGTVKDRAARRRVLEKHMEGANKVYDLKMDPQGLAMEAANDLYAIADAGIDDLQDAEYGLDLLLDRQRRIQMDEKVGVVPTYISMWDRYLNGGLTPGILTCIGGQPSGGKTAMKSRMILNLALRGYMVGAFELEDSILAFLRRLVSARSRIMGRRIGNRKLTDHEMAVFERAVQDCRKAAKNIIIENRRGLSAAQIAAKSRQMVKSKGCQVLFIDNSSEVDHNAAEGERADLRISHGVRLIRDVPLELDVPLVMLVHFHRPKDCGDKEPRNVRPTSGMWRGAGAYEEAMRIGVGTWMDPERPGFIANTVVKQTEGDKDYTFYVPMDDVAGLAMNDGGDGPPIRED